VRRWLAKRCSGGLKLAFDKVKRPLQERGVCLIRGSALSAAAYQFRPRKKV
jgi:hypothetical protein